MTLKFCKFMVAGALLALVPSAHAQERERNNNMASGGDVWRIELRNLEHFLAMTSGDSDGVSEVSWVRISLKGREGQYQTVTETNPFLSINGGPRSRNNSIDVRPGDRVFLERLDEDTTDTYNMWVHTQEVTGGDIDGPMLRFEIEVATRELDCTRDRVCRRGSTGVVTYSVNMPAPTRRDNTCNAFNTYRITAVNGATMVLQPLNAAPGRGRDVSVRHSYSGGDPVGYGSNSGVQLAMQSGRICAAWTGG